MTVKLNDNKGLQQRTDRRPTGNSMLPQLAVISLKRDKLCNIEAEYSYQTLVQIDSVVLRNRQLRQHAKRYRSLLKDSTY
jgi:hypothetical protein